MSTTASVVARAVVLLGAVAGLSASQTSPPPVGESMLMSTADLAAHLQNADLLVLQVAESQAVFEQEHIPGARFVRYADIAVDGDRLGSELPSVEIATSALEASGVSDGSRIVVYSPSTVAAARLFFTLDVLGHAHVALLDGGLRAWKADGRQTAHGPPAATPRGHFTARLHPERMAGAEWIQQRLGTSQMSLVDVRPDQEFTGSDGGMGGVHVPGHISGAQQLPWDTLVDASGRFLPVADLQAKLAAAGVGPGKPVVSYCMVGMRASVVYFVARYLGYEARLYDGSIVDWGRRGLPTVKGR